jgi:protocatechuate 3,4-dioxygenase beta subunit
LPVDTKELSHGDLKTILGHELAHLRQGDAWINWLQLLLMAAWWFHPVFWVLHRNLRRVREDCCDDSLIAGGLASADEYCSTLLRVARQSSSRRIHVACSMADGLHPLSKRLRRILDPGVRRRVRISIVNLMLVILAASVLLPGLRSQLIQSREATGAAKAVAAADEFAIPKDLPVAKPEIDRFAGYKEYATGFEPLKISGRCIDVNDKPVVGASVMLMLNEFGDLNYIDENGERQTINNKFATVQSDADGRYEFNTAQFPVKEYKPNPVEKPRDASFGLLATADDFAIAWRGSRTVRFQDRPAVLDPDEAASLFFTGEPIELDLVFQQEVQVHGIVTDDTGQPLAGATVQLGLVNDSRALAGQKERMYAYDLITPASRADSSPGWNLSELPEVFREVQTDEQGRYTIRGMPPNTRALFSVDYKRTWPMYSSSLKSVNGESDRNDRYIGTGGEFNVALTRPRTLSLTLAGDSGAPPKCIIRADDVARNSQILRDGAMVESIDGKALLELPPGKYKLFVEPLPGQRYVSSSHEVEILQQPLEQTAEFTVVPGAEVLLRAIVKGAKTAVEGVGFSVQTDDDKPPVELQSQTVYVDHPRTNSDGVLTAVVNPGTMSFLPTSVPQGFVAVALKSDVLNLESGTRKEVTFELDGSIAEPAPPENPLLAKLYKQGQHQNKLLSSGRYTFRRHNFLQGAITPRELDEVIAVLEGKSAANAEAILKHVFPNLNFSHQSLMLVQGRRLAVGHTWGTPAFSWNGMIVSDVSVQNGVEQLLYSAENHQLDINDVGKSSIHIGSLSELVTVPSLGRQLPDGLSIEERDGRIFLFFAGAVVAVDAQTGFLYQTSFIDPDGNGRTTHQFGPVTHANGAVTPTLRVEAHFRENKLDRAEVAFLDKVEFVDDFPAGTFSLAAPPGTNMLDYRDTDRNRVGSGPRDGVTIAPVSDAVAKANEKRPPVKSSERAMALDSDAFAPPAKKGLRINDEAPAFEVAGWYDQDGKTDAPDFRGKFVIVSFNAESQVFAHEYRALRDALKRFEDKDVVFVHVFASTKDAENARIFMKESLFPWKFAVDAAVEGEFRSRGKTFTAFHVSHPTTTIVINASGRVVAELQHTEQSRYAVKMVDQMLGPKE